VKKRKRTGEGKGGYSRGEENAVYRENKKKKKKAADAATRKPPFQKEADRKQPNWAKYNAGIRIQFSPININLKAEKTQKTLHQHSLPAKGPTKRAKLKRVEIRDGKKKVVSRTPGKSVGSEQGQKGEQKGKGKKCSQKKSNRNRTISATTTTERDCPNQIGGAGRPELGRAAGVHKK